MAKVVETLIEFHGGPSNDPDRFEVRLWLDGPVHDHTGITTYLGSLVHANASILGYNPTTESLAESISNSAMVAKVLNAVQVKDLGTNVSTLIYPEWP